MELTAAAKEDNTDEMHSIHNLHEGILYSKQC